MVAASRRAGLWLSVTLVACSSAPDVVSLPPPEVTVSQPIERTLSDEFRTTGRTQAVESVEIRARVSGYIDQIDFTYGAMVEAGQVLYQIDPRPYEAEVLRAEGTLAKWQAALAQAKADSERAQRLLPRGAASQKELDTAIADRDASVAEIKSAEAALEQAKLDLDFTKVKSPIAGRVSRSNLTVGNLVQAGATGSDPLTTVRSVKPIWVYFDLDERTLLNARENARRAGAPVQPEKIAELEIPVDIGLANDPGFVEQGILDFVDNTVDPNTGTIKVRAVFPNEDERLVPGLFVRVRMRLGQPHPTMLVPERAIGTDQGNKFVLAVNQENVVEYVPVELGPTKDEGLRVVRDGLEPGAWIIVNGLQRVRPGITVKPQKTSLDDVAPDSEDAAPPAAAPSAPAEPAESPAAATS